MWQGNKYLTDLQSSHKTSLDGKRNLLLIDAFLILYECSLSFSTHKDHKKVMAIQVMAITVVDFKSVAKKLVKFWLK